MEKPVTPMVPVPNPIKQAVEAFWENQSGRRSNRIGASIIGHECKRRIFYSFRWCYDENISGRIKRLFERGKREEEVVHAELRGIGAVVTDDQKEVTFDQSIHIVARIDGIVKGLPGAPRKVHLLEIKTLNKSGFGQLLSKGISEQHMAQINLAGYGLGIDDGLYYPVCKDNDDIAPTRVKINKTDALSLIYKGVAVINSKTPPPRISDKPSFFLCKMCPAYEQCHFNAPLSKTCRSCQHVEVTNEDTGWFCTKHQKYLQLKDQEEACDDYNPISEALPGFSRGGNV